jgi:hypothetical protein
MGIAHFRKDFFLPANPQSFRGPSTLLLASDIFGGIAVAFFAVKNNPLIENILCGQPE